ncbi:TetR/AcrR family transcriptional regulator [Sphaerisporangium sp. TRM90804]|uniref:TetR/AcrR family transcriptional regulator n=1 Tax=Sphaerisporangium sp. TRM90804 TaxID=3031113 RepID=UPI00244B7B0D|nr:TetR/AcrR family transcriptional regulator [Sphaerisporangium sp. TRM90804]MDH2425957.1 TetR/AcrR family transcriptional regulator [Sphaerisporangium sp. TRM90804]
MVVFAGRGDARRSMALLWRREKSAEARTGPGPKPGLSVDMIVDAAIAVADTEGMPALSMRAVGERLGRTAMALYTYVPNKGELLDLMYDRALSEVPTEFEGKPSWRDAVTSWAEEFSAFYLRHPWVLLVSQARPVLGPNEFAVRETVVRILRETGLESRVLRGVVASLFHYVRGSAQMIAESRQAASATGVSDDDWWYSRSGVLEEVAPDFAERFPASIWLEQSAGPPPAEGEAPYLEREAKDVFTIGLTVLLDGIETTMVRSGDPAARAADGAVTSPR